MRKFVDSKNNGLDKVSCNACDLTARNHELTLYRLFLVLSWNELPALLSSRSSRLALSCQLEQARG